MDGSGHHYLALDLSIDLRLFNFSGGTLQLFLLTGGPIAQLHQVTSKRCFLSRQAYAGLLQCLQPSALLQ